MSMEFVAVDNCPIIVYKFVKSVDTKYSSLIADLETMASRLTTQEALAEAFHFFDPEKKGIIEDKKIRALLQSLDMDVTEVS